MIDLIVTIVAVAALRGPGLAVQEAPETPVASAAASASRPSGSSSSASMPQKRPAA